MISKDLSILVVDDMKFNCAFISKVLHEAGYADIRIANTAAEALQQLQQRDADVVLADWIMPEMDGLEMTDCIRQIDEEKNHYTAVILLTAKDTMNDLTMAFDRGVDDYLVKPPNQQELAARIYAAGRIASMHNNLLDSMASLRAEMSKNVTRDALTRLGNKRELETRVDELIRQCRSRGGVAVCLAVQINEYPKLLQQAGQGAAHEVVRSVATRLGRSIRPTDILTRIDDDTFMIAMHYPDAEHVRPKIFRRILLAINMRPIKSSMGFLNISVAIGGSFTEEGDERDGVESLVDAAIAKIPASRDMGCRDVAL